MRAILRALPVVCAIVLVVAALARAILHLRDLNGIQHIAGIWMALAQYGNAGVLYPSLEADGVYAGTRYMPLCFGLIAALVRIVGDYVLAAKLMALLSMTALLGGVFVAVRRITGRAVDAVVLTALVLASAEGRAALESPHADALAAAFAVWGLLGVDQSQRQKAKVFLFSFFLFPFAFCLVRRRADDQIQRRGRAGGRRGVSAAARPPLRRGPARALVRAECRGAGAARTRQRWPLSG
jgi:hypothetical protein